MTRPVTIALDAMGGDHGPSVVIPGAALTLALGVASAAIVGQRIAART